MIWAHWRCLKGGGTWQCGVTGGVVHTGTVNCSQPGAICLCAAASTGTPHPRELSNTVTVSRLSYCKVTHLHHCDSAEFGPSVFLYFTYLCDGNRCGFFSLSEGGKTGGGQGGRWVEKENLYARMIETLMQASGCVCNVYLFDANSGVQSIPLI